MAVSRGLKDRSAAIEGETMSADTAFANRYVHVHMLECLCIYRASFGTAGVEQWPYKAVAVALEVIPRTLAQNCGANVIR